MVPVMNGLVKRMKRTRKELFSNSVRKYSMFHSNV